MHKRYLSSPIAVAIVVAIGCGGGRPQEAAATTDRSAPQHKTEQPIQLAQALEASEAPAAGGSTVKGTIHFDGTAPKPEAIKMDADPVCQQQHKEVVHKEDVVVNPNATLKNVFVYVKDGVKGTYPTPTTPAVLNQSGCWYQPHILGIQVNQPLEIVNSDSTLHNINAKPKVNVPFNIAQPVKGMKTTKTFAKPEVMVRFKCNVHPWMSAYMGVVPHPFFSVSDAQGKFTITGLPAGTYTIEAWHEVYGTQTQTVTVADGATTELEFSFTASTQ